MPVDNLVPVSDIDVAQSQPRTVFADEEIRELADSIAQLGVLLPLLVRPGGSGRWHLVAGERRLRAARLAGLTEVPVREIPEDADEAVIALVENVQRVDLNPVEEGLAYKKLIEEQGLTQEDVARATGKSRTHVSSCIGFVSLPEEVGAKLAAGVITRGHARVLLGLPSASASRLCERIVREGLSVSATREAVVLGDIEDPAGVDQPQRGQRQGSQPSKSRQSAAASWAEELESYLMTKVSWKGSSAKMSVTIHVADAQDLSRVRETLRKGYVSKEE